MGKKLRSAVVGVGYLGTFHAQKHKNNSLVDFKGVFDVYAPQAQKVAESLGVKAYTQLQSLVGEVDLVTVASTTQSHFEICEFLLNSGIHVNVEKPITAEVHQAEKLIALAKKNNLKLSVGHIERFNPVFKKWNELKSKTPKFMELYRMGPFKERGTDVSVLHDLMIHDMDLVSSLNVGELKKVQVEGQIVKSKTHDWAVAFLEYSSGFNCMIKASRVSPVVRREIWADEWFLNLGQIELEKLTTSEKISIDKVDALQVETDLFIDSVRNNTTAPVSGEAGLLALINVEKVYQALCK